ncbi:hypothetical protein ABH926_009392 [Catenulispora sp. GP43]|uniref:hypothetical protein n=1 Tax=Catenulispora sp. GP43 TaxID=3156263 RepID=UPI003517A735
MVDLQRDQSAAPVWSAIADRAAVGDADLDHGGTEQRGPRPPAGCRVGDEDVGRSALPPTADATATSMCLSEDMRHVHPLLGDAFAVVAAEGGGVRDSEHPGDLSDTACLADGDRELSCGHFFESLAASPPERLEVRDVDLVPAQESADACLGPSYLHGTQTPDDFSDRVRLCGGLF